MLERDLAIKRRVIALGWDWDKFEKAAVELHVAMGGIYKQGDWYPTAKYILSLYEPGTVIKYFNKPVLGCTESVLMFDYDNDHPMPTEGTFKLVRQSNGS